ncbi:putative transporter [Naviculisporaceae sp. PSN 640]
MADPELPSESVSPSLPSPRLDTGTVPSKISPAALRQSRSRSSSTSSQDSTLSIGSDSHRPLITPSMFTKSRTTRGNYGTGTGGGHDFAPGHELEEGALGARFHVGTGESSSSSSTVAVAQKDKARRITRKLDFWLIPLLSFLYLCNGLDRGNIGNAETQGFTHDIGVKPGDLNLAVLLFFVTFVVLQPVSAAAGRWFGPERWIPIIMFAWGVLTISQAFLNGRASLLATRMLIGAFEAGFYPTAVAYLATFYPPFELAQKLAWFYGQYAIAGAFSGAIAYGIFSIEHPFLKAWQLLFIFEGVLTCVFALVAWVWLPRSPDSAWFLTQDERAYAAQRVDANRCCDDRSLDPDAGPLAVRDVVEAVKDWKLWVLLACNICASVPSTAFSVFLPLVVQGMGYSALEANLMSVPPFVCGAAGLYLFAISSDRHKDRGYHIVGGILVVLVGLILVLTVPTNQGRYVALCVLLFGSYVPPLLTAAWLSGNTPAPGKRAIVLGVMGFGNLAGAIGSGIYRKEYAPEYRTPLFVTLGFVSAALVGYLGYRALLKDVNRRRAHVRRGKTAAQCEAEQTDEERYADQKWTFVYNL